MEASDKHMQRKVDDVGLNGVGDAYVACVGEANSNVGAKEN